MSILTDDLPTAVEVNGQELSISTDFRTCIQAVVATEDGDLTNAEKCLVMLRLMYGDGVDFTQEHLDTAAVFLNGGEVRGDEEPDGVRLFSFEKDARLIFAAFKQTHGVDLEVESMHWWKFMALFSDLGADTVFCTLVGLRKRVKTGVATKEERELALALGDAFDVPDVDRRTLDEREREALFLKLVEKGR